jgi:type IV pilus secretin PilQ/predicted competence protein
MIFTANSRRAAVLSLVSFITLVAPGCIATDSTVAPETSVTDVEPAVSSLDLPVSEGAATNASVSTRGLVEKTPESFGIAVSSAPGLNQVAIETNSGKPEYSIQRLSNPDRLVVDLPSDGTRASRIIAIDDMQFISSLRIGSHPDKSRLVFDLNDSAGVTHDAIEQDGKVIISLRGPTVASDDASSVVAASETESELVQVASNSNDMSGDISEQLLAKAEVEGAQPEKNLEAPRPALPEDVEVVESQQEIQALPVEATPEKNDLGVTQEVLLSAVRLERGAGTSQVVVVDVKGTPEYGIEKTAPSEYVLTVKGAHLAEDIDASTIMAAPDSSGIRSVRSLNSTAGATLRIFAQPQTYLTARLASGKLLVEETTDMVKVSEDIRAQLDPKEVKEEKAPEPIKKDDSVAKPAGSDTAKAKVSGGAELSDTDIGSLLDDSSKYTGRLISLDLQDTDIDNALRIIAEVSNLNIVASDDVTGKVTLRLTDVPWDQALDVILKTNGLDKVIEGNVMRIAPVDKLRQERESLKQAQQAEEELEPLAVKYLRVSYAKASELKALVETILSERGTVAYDERSNQLIIKDVRKGLRNVVELVNKVDLRTPQVLLETQIVEATRSLGRELGAELGFQFIQSPLTGNGTGLNFPAAISIGGTAITNAPGNVTGSSFPASSSAANGSAISALFDSADGTKSLQIRLSQLETEGRVRIISRPAVATTNNKAAQIKSVEKVRVRLPNGGLSVATGAGAAATGAGNIATEVIEAGIILDVTPQASPDYFVLLDIRAKSSSFSSRESGDGIPNEIERSASSTVLVSSGQTFALGGIYKISDADRISGVPFFKDIPFIGHLFRRSVIDNADEELLFFITPRIVEGSFDDASMKASS